MKTKEELSAIKEEVEALSKKPAELTDDVLAEVVGGFGALPIPIKSVPDTFFPDSDKSDV